MKKRKSDVVWECDLDVESKTGWVQGDGLLSEGVNDKTRRYPKTDEACYMSSGFLQEREDEKERKPCA